MKIKNVAVIGAGMAGLAAARALRQAGFAVAIYEKSARAGGRVASRVLAGAVFDSGAQNIKSQDSELENVLQTLQNEARVYIEEPISLRDGARVLAGDDEHNSAPKWSFQGGINNAAQLLARDVKSRGARFFYGKMVAAIWEDERNFALLDADGSEISRADFVILTAPLPQSAALFQASKWRDKSLAEARLAVLKKSEYSRCLSVMLRYQNELPAAWYALLSQERTAPLLWLARENCKFDVDGAALVAQIGHETSCEWWSADDAEIAARTSRLIAQIIGEEFAAPQSFLVKRWRYSQPKNAVDFEEANPRNARVLVAGDGVSAGRVTAAYESGLKAAACIAENASG